MSDLVIAHLPFHTTRLALAPARFGVFLKDLVLDRLPQAARTVRRGASAGLLDPVPNHVHCVDEGQAVRVLVRLLRRLEEALGRTGWGAVGRSARPAGPYPCPAFRMASATTAAPICGPLTDRASGGL